jgi:ubiquinone/menaquinone biosynthesis C-methylase UbiE
MGFERMLRRVVPATARLTYNPVFKVVVNSFDLFPKLMYREMWNIPPNHLRIRVGIGNRILANQIMYLTGARDFWMHVFHEGLCRLDSTIVDIGSGCGRYAHPLRDYQFKSERFSGKYVGIDIDHEMLVWCREHYDSERFSFHRSTHESKAYRGTANGNSYFRLPLKEATADFVFSTIVFTHLLENELVNYCRESHRVLKAGCYMATQCFTMDHPPPTYGDRHTFRFPMGNAFVESLKVPQAAVAYREEFLLAVVRDVGFRSAEIQTSPGDWQPLLVCRK